jgi:hypothetical protein
MTFYYFSSISTTFAAIISAIAFAIFWFIWTKVLDRKLTIVVTLISAAALLVLPWTEELWIAYNFGRGCKTDAGTFIIKTVEAEGFYDATGVGSLELVRSGTYRFIESRSSGDRYTRLTQGDIDFMRHAMERYKEVNPDKDLSKQQTIRVSMDERTEALIFPRNGDSWRITRLDAPTARYHFVLDPGFKANHKVVRQSSTVTDSESRELLGRYVRYSREPPWFYIGLNPRNLGCDGPEGGPDSKKSFLIYREILKPIGQR